MADNGKPGLSYKARRRWSLVILLVGLPLYIIVAVSIMNMLDRPPILVELLIYIVLGVAWALPFRFVFRGIGQADPDAADKSEKDPRD
ncbi:DUF2842 domain-containing protein [Sedimentitalea sp. HM32M-2]|uniref:DUF2842 domain-containing protein n=1 Tax=Sedimentitalea sp. HM32M-2 TaxID=3351566 RepID=UPI00362CB0DE